MSDRTIRVAGPESWEPLLTERWKKLPASLGSLAGSLLRDLHDRHLGITPDLAAELAIHLTPGIRKRGRPTRWQMVDRRLTEEWRKEPVEGGLRLGFEPAACPTYYVERVAVPLLESACRQETWLFSEASQPPQKSFLEDYALYGRNVTRRLLQAPGELFRIDRAMTVEHLARQAAGGASLPETDVLGLAFLHRLEPRRDEHEARSRTRRPRSPSPRRPLQHRNRGGVDGIRISRRLEDLPSMLKSELLYPRLLRLERLLHSGYLVLRRPPRRETARDVLLLGMLPPLQDVSPLAVAFARAAWFHAMMRLSLQLLKIGREKSEIVWLEADRLGRWREQRFRLLDLPADLPWTDEPNDLFRRDFIALLGWMPGFLDRHAGGRPVRLRGLPSAWAGDRDGDPFRSWLQSVPGELEDDARWQVEGKPLAAGGRRSGGRRSGPRRALDFDAFAVRHFMVLAPAARSQGLQPELSLGGLRRDLGLKQGGPGLSVVFLPERFTHLGSDGGWALTDPANRHLTELLDPAETEGDPDFEHRLAGVLVNFWVETVLEDVTRD